MIPGLVPGIAPRTRRQCSFSLAALSTSTAQCPLSLPPLSKLRSFPARHQYYPYDLVLHTPHHV
jgi:hypothetical protein